MTSLTDSRLTQADAPLKQVHFSYYILGYCLVWAMLSLYVFSDHNLHAFNDTHAIAPDFPGPVTQWKITSEEEVVSLCDDALCLNTSTNKRTRVVLDIPVAQSLWEGVDQLVFEATVSNTPTTTTRAPSYIVARARSSAGKNLRNVGSVITLDEPSTTQLHRRVSTLHPQTSQLQLVVIMRSASSVKIDNVVFHTITLRNHYRIARAVVFAGWLILMLVLALHMLSRFSRTTQIICATVFTVLMTLGASQFARILTGQLTQLIGGNWLTHLSRFLSLSNDASLSAIHFAFHLALTLWLGRNTKPRVYSMKHIVSLNLSIAIGVECAQMGMPGRSADIHDLAAAMFGTVIALVLLQNMQALTNYQLKAQPDNKK